MQIAQTTTEYENTQINAAGYIRNKDCRLFNIQEKLLDIIESLSAPKKELSLEEQINEKFLELDFGSEFEINAAKIGAQDAIFFVNLLNQNNLIDYKVDDDKLSLSLDDKKIPATNSLLNMLKTSLDTKKAIRLDFESDITVILKLDKEGKIQAHFIPGTSAAENYLKNNIPALKQTFDEEQINYSYLGYQNQNRNKNKDDNKKEQKKEQ